jgi:hypothetical protein
MPPADLSQLYVEIVQDGFDLLQLIEAMFSDAWKILDIALYQAADSAFSLGLF